MRYRNPIRRRAPARLGMDELMIVNPVGDGIEAVFLGVDGRFYRRTNLIAGPCLRCARRGRRIRNF
jgi:hypothetical protein